MLLHFLVASSLASGPDVELRARGADGHAIALVKGSPHAHVVVMAGQQTACRPVLGRHGCPGLEEATVVAAGPLDANGRGAFDLWLPDLAPGDDLDLVAVAHAAARPQGPPVSHEVRFSEPVRMAMGGPDADRDGLADALEALQGSRPDEADTDGGGIPDGMEFALGTDPRDPADEPAFEVLPPERAIADLNPDSDGDGLLDVVEMTQTGTHPYNVDTDGDGLSDRAELDWYTDPLQPDTDGDGRRDGDEVRFGTDPRLADAVDTSVDDQDTDGDGLLDRAEVLIGTDPDAWDTDGDGTSDGEEIGRGTNPKAAPISPRLDGDLDGLSDQAERWIVGTDPLVADTDGDGFMDGEEAQADSDPLDPTSIPESGVLSFEFAPLPGHVAVTEAGGRTALGIVEGGPPLGSVVFFTGQPSNEPLRLGNLEVAGAVRIREDGKALVHLAFSADAVGSVPVHALISDGDGRFGFTEPFTVQVYDSASDPDGDHLASTTERARGLNPQASDSDGGGRPDGFELAMGTDPSDPRDDDQLSADVDGDGIPDHLEMRRGWGVDDIDSDDDGVPDGQEDALGTNALSADTDHDRLTDADELARGTDPRIADTDGDEVLDGDEVWFGTDPLRPDSRPDEGEPDSDGDGIPDDLEAGFGTRPDLADTDGDGIDDAIELVAGTDPREPESSVHVDQDDDGIPDEAERTVWGTDPSVADSDGDGWDDGLEVIWNTDPTDADSFPGQPAKDHDRDGDGLSDRAERLAGTDPDDPDTDHDGLPDGAELQRWGSDPLNPDSDNGGVADGFEVMVNQTHPVDRTDDIIDPDGDADGDGLTNAEELLDHGSNPYRADTDEDGLDDGEEVHNVGSSPIFADTDGDEIYDRDEVELYLTDPNRTDTDGGGADDWDELFLFGSDPTLAGDDCGGVPYQDSDGDKLCDAYELERYDTDPFSADTDGGIRDDYTEIRSGLDPLFFDDDYWYRMWLGARDSDGDSVSDGGEEVGPLGGRMFSLDGDRDSLPDAWEAHASKTPGGIPDSDEDGLSDLEEWIFRTDPLWGDTDGGGFNDYIEVYWHGTNPRDPEDDLDGTGLDSDQDGLSDWEERTMYYTDPFVKDTDGGGVPDGVEVAMFMRDYRYIQKTTRTHDYLENADRSRVRPWEWVDETPHDFNFVRPVIQPGRDLGDHRCTTQFLARSGYAAPMDGSRPRCATQPLDPHDDGGVDDVAATDTDRDGLSDWVEVEVFGTRPTSEHTDSRFRVEGTIYMPGDGVEDWTELYLFHRTSDPLNPNTGYVHRVTELTEMSHSDDIEYAQFSNPRRLDSDEDGLLDRFEVRWGAYPFDPDTDNDGVSDGEEILGRPQSDARDPCDPNPHHRMCAIRPVCFPVNSRNACPYPWSTTEPWENTVNGPVVGYRTYWDREESRLRVGEPIPERRWHPPED
ncbi:MAG: hypothetical protein AAGA48_19020 [Myxococcota bacterium]